jgi:PEP-CTERM motif
LLVIICSALTFCRGSYLPASYRDSSLPWYEDICLGSRVVEVPEPATLMLLAVGGLAVMRRSSLADV